jgi:integrase
MKLTATTVEGLPKVDKPTVFWDQSLRGFGVRVLPPTAKSPAGVRNYVVNYRASGGGRGAPQRRLTIGATSKLTADEARKLAKKALASVAHDEDPAAERNEVRRSATVANLAARYQNEAGAGRKASTERLFESYWRLWIIPEIGAIRARDVKHTDIARLHRKIGASHRITANRIITHLGHFYRWAGAVGAVPEGCNPAKTIERYKESAKDRYLTTAELERLGAAIVEAETVGIPWEEDPNKPRSKHAPKKPESRRTKITPHAAGALRLLLLTGARLREILHLRWSEVDLERGLLLLPDSKTGRKTIILGNAALTVIADLDKVSEYVIAGQAKPRKPGEQPEKDKPRSDLNRPWALVSKHAGLKGVRLHDLRHTFASYGAAGGLGLPVIGGLLGHASPKTTQRYAHLGSDPLRRASEAISSEISAAIGRAGKRAQADG